MAADYANDFYGWATETAEKLRSGRLSEVDLEHVAEEIESLGKSEQQQLSSRLVVLLTHMLKWEFQPEAQKGGWEATIKLQRLRIRRLLDKNPSLKPLFWETVEESYPLAVIHAAEETNKVEEDFPRTCPYSKEEILG
jgi:hypothetical protein